MKSVLSAEIQKSMIDSLNSAIASWTHSEDTKVYAKDYAKDRKDLRRIRSFFRQGRMEECRDAVYQVDTIVRDVIPCDMYNYIYDITQ